MSEAMEWQGDNLLLTLERDPESILVRLFPAKYALRRLYVFETAAYRSKELERENAELRELVRDMSKWLWNGADCTECPFTAECDLNAAFESDLHAHICIGWSEIHDRMRELGVEVE